MTKEAPWWKGAVFYQIYPRSFAEKGGNEGVGNLAGIESKLDYLKNLGVDCIWLSPIYPSPNADYGYDVADYQDVHEMFGTLEDFDRLLDKVHSKNMRLILDWVPNHTSTEHEWFKESRSSKDNPKRDWYIWKEAKEDGSVPNNWRAFFTEHLKHEGVDSVLASKTEIHSGITNASVWAWDEKTQEYYFHLFHPQQADLNWYNPDVESAMLGTLKFWLDRGVDGFRIDVIPALYKNPTFEDDPIDKLNMPHRPDSKEIYKLVQRIRSVVNSYEHDPVLVGEAYMDDLEKVTDFYDNGKGLQMAFNFPAMLAEFSAESWKANILEAKEFLLDKELEPAWVFGNHDQSRVVSRLGGRNKAKIAALLGLTLPGVAFIYQGEELGLEDAVVPKERQKDPGGRDSERAPIPWTKDEKHGWSSEEAWLPWPPESVKRSVESQEDSKDSFLNFYKDLLFFRNFKLERRQLGNIYAQDGVLAYTVENKECKYLVVLNFEYKKKHFNWQGDVLINTHKQEEQGQLAEYQGLVIKI